MDQQFLNFGNGLLEFNIKDSLILLISMSADITELESKIESGKRSVKNKGYWTYKYNLQINNCIKHKNNNDIIIQAIFL